MPEMETRDEVTIKAPPIIPKTKEKASYFLESLVYHFVYKSPCLVFQLAIFNLEGVNELVGE